MFKKKVTAETKVVEPIWVGFEPEKLSLVSNESDFRNEIIDLIKKNKDLKYKILVAETKNSLGLQNWTQIGTITFTEAVASEPCDKELHFHHPRTDD